MLEYPVPSIPFIKASRWLCALAVAAVASAADPRPVPPGAGPPPPPGVAPPRAVTPPAVVTPPPAPAGSALNPAEELGRLLFHDRNLSQPAGTSCASCHNPQRGFAGNHGGTAGVPLGATGASGLRNTPTAMYASFTPSFAVVIGRDGPRARGGQFLDGRVDTLAQQALGPLLAAAEMNNPDAAAVVKKVAASAYAPAFRKLWGEGIFATTEGAFTAIGRSIEAYERSVEFHPFSSRYDDLLAGRDTFTAAERRGMGVFFDPAKGNCMSCHAANRQDPNPAASLFTNHAYVAIGVPRNPAIPANSDPAFFDLGLAGPQRAAPAGLANAAGAFKVPTLRNVALKTAFMHNGRFKSLQEVVGFYATRDIDPRRWYPGTTMFDDLPVALRGNVTRQPPFDLHRGDRPRLTPQDVADVVAFLGTLTDAPSLRSLTVPQ